ncbi:putative Alternative oxidase [Leishmania naiffi]|uniref:Alternative oxidase n=1 Tax=Leishmania naiffi TaxID=5678 RepID=A0AAW3B1Q5_9TRYP
MRMSIRSNVCISSAALSCHRRSTFNDSGHVGVRRTTLRTTSFAGFSGSKSVLSPNAFAASSVGSTHPSSLYHFFMGHSTRFAAMAPPLTRAGITQLEREPLTHNTPGRINDHICIVMVKTLRWLADRVFRERYIHRATMLVTVAAAAPAAGSVAAYLRMHFKRRHSSNTGSDGGSTCIAAEGSSPFLAFGSSPSTGGAPPIPGASRSFATARPSHCRSTSSAATEGTRSTLEHSYGKELRGLFAQCESHSVHYQVLSCMADITLAERALVLLLQAIHFTIYLALFLFYPRMGFRLMAYTAEESSVVWTQMVNDVDLGKIAEMCVPQLALQYWGLEGAFTTQAAPVSMAVTSHDQEQVLYKTSDGGAEEQISFVDAANSGISPHGIDASNRTATSPSPAVDHVSVPFTVSCSPSESVIDTKESEGHTIIASELGAGSAASVLTLRDVALLIRSDEMVFRDLNHELANKLDTQPSWLQRLVDFYGSEK